MRKEVLLAFSALALVILIFGATVWLANAPLHPPIQSTHLAVPDERIPH